MSLDTMTREEIEAELTPLGKKLSEAITGDGEGLTEDEKDRWGVLHKAWVDAAIDALHEEIGYDDAVEIGQSIGEMSSALTIVKGFTDDL